MTITASAPISFATAIGVQPEAARALDDDRVAVAHADLLQAVRHLRERAVYGRRHLVGDLVGHLEDPAARLQVVVLAVGAAELAHRPGAHRHQLVRAGRELGLVALVAAVARIEVAVADAVAFLERPAERVGRDARAERVHAARHLVPGDAAGHRREQRRVAAPDVQVGAADAAHRHLDHDRRPAPASGRRTPGSRSPCRGRAIPPPCQWP